MRKYREEIFEMQYQLSDAKAEIRLLKQFGHVKYCEEVINNAGSWRYADCAVCMQQKQSMCVIYPCGHIYTCAECFIATNLRRCFACNTQITACFRVYDLTKSCSPDFENELLFRRTMLGRACSLFERAQTIYWKFVTGTVYWQSVTEWWQILIS